MPRTSLIKWRQGTAAEWTSANPTLESGEPAFETDTGKIKVGDGTTAWTSLAYTTDTLFTSALASKLSGIEDNATADQSGAEIKAAYEGEADTNAFTDALASKLDGIEAAADVTDATNVNAAGATMNADTDVSGNSWVVDEDDMASDSATKVPTQQSVKAYVDTEVGTAEPALGNPASDDMVLSSKADGTRSWVDVASSGEDPSGATIYGVMATSQTANDGVGLQHIDRYGRVITLTTADFDAHACYGGDTAFAEYTDGDSNVFCKVPIAYWWRGTINGKWCMLISDQPGTYAGKTFTASPGAFLQDGEWMEQFYIGKYRGHDAGDSKIGSKSGQTHLGNVSFNNWRTYCANVGTGYHLLSLFEWHEILARMVVEKATFQLVPEASRTTAGSCVYRGITDFAYSGTVYAEWMDGIRTDASGKWELWDEADGTYISSGMACLEYSGSNYYPPSLSAYFPYLFLGGGACVAIASAWVPDLNGRPTGYVSRICYSSFLAGGARDGALYTNFSSEATDAGAAIGGRLAKW